MTDFLLADTETTGVAASDRVVEVAWLLMDEGFNTLDKGNSLIDPGIPIPAGASAVHGITNRDVAGAPTIDQYFGDVLGNRLGVGEFIFTAHNSSFDFRYLERFLPEGTPQLCTLKLARRLWPNADNHKLGTLVYELDLDVEKDRFHSADGDMAVLMALLGRMTEEFGYSLQELFELANTSTPITPDTPIGFGKHRGTPLKNLPPNYVWWLLNKADNLDADLRAALQKL